tara:strand:+ start:29 stop:1915 length:1887 start_codon:yes stop_codon:yes gene_type:complete
VSIDREINSRVNAYSSNPQALQKKYSVSKDLVDLLALQKIKKGMDEERRNIAMAMQTNPATIKQQREQEVFGRTAQDVAQQLGGILQTAKNRQQMARRRPAPQGLGALMPQQGQRPQQPQTRMMQAGGIVAFQEGNLVGGRLGESARIESSLPERSSLLGDMATQEDIAELIRRGILPENFKGSLSAERAEEMLARPISQEPKTVDTPPPVEPKPPTSDQTGGITTAVQPKIPTAENALVLRDQGKDNQDTPKNTQSRTMPPVDRGTTPSAPKPFDLQGALDKVGDAPDPVMVDRTGLERRGVDFTKAYGVDPASIDPEARGVAALQKAEDYYGVKEKDAELRKGLADLAALDAAQTDPDKLRRDRLKRFLLGGAGRGSTALAGAGAASANLGAAQQRDIRSRQIKRNEMLKDIQNQDIEVRKLAKGEERAAIERADNLKMNALKIISNMSSAELSARQTDANAMNQANLANYKAKMDRVGLLLEQSNAEADQAIARAQLASLDANRRGQIANTAINNAMDRMGEIDTILVGIYEDQVNNDPELFSLRNSLSTAESEEDRQGILDNIQARKREILTAVELNQVKLNNEKENLKNKVVKLRTLRDNILSGGISDIPVSTQEQSLVDQYK